MHEDLLLGDDGREESEHRPDTPGGGDLGVGGASEGLSVLVPEAELDRRTTGPRDTDQAQQVECRSNPGSYEMSPSCRDWTPAPDTHCYRDVSFSC